MFFVTVTFTASMGFLGSLPPLFSFSNSFVFCRSRQPWSRRNRRGSSGCPTRWSSSSRPCLLRAESNPLLCWERERERESERERENHGTGTDYPKRSPGELQPWSRPETSVYPQPNSFHDGTTQPPADQNKGSASRADLTWKEHQQRRKKHGLYLFIYLKDISFWQETVFCVCMSVRLRCAEELCRTARAKRRNRFILHSVAKLLWGWDRDLFNVAGRKPHVGRQC